MESAEMMRTKGKPEVTAAYAAIAVFPDSARVLVRVQGSER